MVTSRDAFQSLFVAELAALDRFAAEREERRALPLGREDPDVRRLLEALAFFAARTRAVAADEMRRAVRRMAAGVIDDLMTPMPAMGLLQAVPDERVVEPMILPRGAALRAVTPQGKVAILSTTRSLRILPIAVERVNLESGQKGLALSIRLAARTPQRGVGEFCFQVRRLGDYLSSLALFDALREHVRRVSVVFDPRGDGEDEAMGCGVAFGAGAADPIEDDDGQSPLHRIRSFFHLPEQDLVLRVRVPVPAQPFRRAVLRVELDERWPEDIGVTRDSLQLFVVPVANRWSDFAEPILWDGTRDSVPIRSAAVTLESVVMDALRGVYKSGDKGLVPILPAALARTGDYFEFEEDDAGAPRVALAVAEAFEKPCKVLVDAAWSQPDLWTTAVGKLSLSLQRRHLAGVSFQMLGELRSPEPSALAESPQKVLDVLARRSRPLADTRDLRGMLEILGASGKSPYRGAPALIDDLTLREAPDLGRRGHGIKYVYRLSLRQRAPEDAPLLHRFTREVGALLDAWSEESVEVETATRPSSEAQALLGGGG